MPNPTEPCERREVFFSGRVQGVGFRYTARQMAGRRPLGGWVENLADGRVHLVVEGDRRDIDDFLGDLETQMQRMIAGKDVSVGPCSGDFDGFSVRT